MINISNRLKTVASIVLKQQTEGIIDVGCDQALLDIYLLQNNEDLKIVASDLREQPLKSAKKNIEKYSFLNKIELKLQDGLGRLDDYIDTVVISGMGEETIIDILNSGKENLKQVNRLIISSNNKFPRLRKEINEMGFVINDERIVYEEDKYYIIMEFIKGNKKYNKKELFFGPFLLKNKNDLFYQYFNYLKNVDSNILKDVPKDNKRAKDIINEIKILDEEI